MSDEPPIQVERDRPFYLQPWFIVLDLAFMVLVAVLVLSMT